MDKTLHFKFDKETKGAVRYKECNEDGSDLFGEGTLTTIYVRKSALPGRVVERLTVTVKGE